MHEVKDGEELFHNEDVYEIILMYTLKILEFYMSGIH